MNCLFNSVEAFLNVFKDKEIVFYGAGSIAARIAAIVQAFNREIKCIVDKDEKKQGEVLYGVPVISPYDLLNEDKSRIIVLLTLTAYEEAEQTLNGMGYIKDENYTSLGDIVRGKATDTFDPFLGYTRTDDIEGFSFLGSADAEIKILTVGGSTTDCSTGGINSWPYYLYEKCMENDVDCLIINGGMSGYYSGQELLKLLRDGIYFNPNLVISYSGYNDAGNSACDDLRYPLVSSYLRNAVGKMNQIKKRGYGYEKEITDAENWIKNTRMMNAISKEFDAAFFSFLQPCIHTGDYILDEREQVAFSTLQRYLNRNVDTITKFYENVKNEINNIPYIHDFTNIFAGMSGIFYDACHCGEEGNQIIANEIYIKIQSVIEK